MDPSQDEGHESDSDSKAGLLRRPTNARRRSSISDTLHKITLFDRRRTTTGIALSNEATNSQPPSRLPTATGSSLTRTASFFNTLSNLASKSSAVPERDKLTSPAKVRHTRKLSERLSLSSAPFFAQNQLSRDKAPTPYPRQKAKPSVHIPQHGFMQPIRPGVLPRSSTTGNLGQSGPTAPMPSFMRPTSNSTRRHSQSQGQRVSLAGSTKAPSAAPTRQDVRVSSVKQNETQQVKLSAHADNSYPLYTAKEREAEPESDVSYGTDEEVETGSARAMTITPVRSVSSHNPFSENHTVYGLPDKHEPSKRDSSKPFDNLISRPVHLVSTPPHRGWSKSSKPLPTLTPDRSRDKLQELLGLDNDDVAQLTRRDSVEYYRRRSDNRTAVQSPYYQSLIDDDYTPKGVEFAAAPSDEEEDDDRDIDEFVEEDTVIHNEEGDLIKGALAHPAASQDVGITNNEGETGITHAGIAPVDNDGPRRVTTAQPPTFWLGRLTSLSDRLRTEALAESMNNIPSLSINEAHDSPNHAHPMHDDNRRYRRVFMELYSHCATDEATLSLRQFQGYWEARRAKDFGAAPLAYGGTGGTFGGAGWMNEAGGSATGSGKVKEKKGVFERMGLRRKSGLSGSGGV